VKCRPSEASAFRVHVVLRDSRIDFARLHALEALLRIDGTYLTLFGSFSTAAAMARQTSTSSPFQRPLAVGRGKADHAGADAEHQLRALAGSGRGSCQHGRERGGAAASAARWLQAQWRAMLGSLMRSGSQGRGEWNGNAILARLGFAKPRSITLRKRCCSPF